MRIPCSSLQWLRIVALTMFVSLVGCSVPGKPSPIPSTTIAPSVTNTQVPSPIPSTRTPTSSPVSPTFTPSPTWTSVPPTPTAAPTLTTAKEQALVLGLLQNNAGCQLPCWWGFTPGRTSWSTTQAFFMSLGKTTAKFSDSSLTNYTVKFQVSQHDMQIGQVYNVSDDIIDMIWVSAGTLRSQGTVYGDAQFTKDWKRYMLPQLLTAYGRPTQVLLKTYSGVPEGWIPFHLLLFYPQQGILVRYYGPTQGKGEQLYVCPYQGDITMWLWSPDRTMTLEDIAKIGQDFPVEEVPDFRSLEEVTDTSLEAFYTTFKDVNNRTCLKTPVNMWR